MTFRLDRVTRDLDPPFAVVDLDALRANAADLTRRANGLPIRVASKSVRCRDILRLVLDLPGYTGILAYTLAEALWLAAEFEDVVVGYPTADRDAIRRLAADPAAAARVTLMVDSGEHLDYVDSVVPPQNRPSIRVCLDLDASLRALGGRLHLGPRRSPVHEPEQAGELASRIAARPGFRLVGLMAYEGQVAGVADRPPGQMLRIPAIRAMKAASVRDLAERRVAAVAAVQEVCPLKFVNGGGTGSMETTVAESAITEVAAGSGLYGPGLFDRYRAFRPEPAALFALAVTRRPAPRIATVAGGGWIASGPPGRDRQPLPTYPAGLRLLPTEGAGEVQTPLAGRVAAALGIGDRVWFRHAKAGELCEHVDELYLIDGDEISAVVPTYRGERKTFL